MASYLSRYLAGEHQGVWTELVSLGPRAREPKIIEDAQAVADETMRRAARNVDLITDFLLGAGYAFSSEPRESPASDVTERMAAAERRLGGPLPLSLRACFQHLGRVWLAGSHAEWPHTWSTADGFSWDFTVHHPPEELEAYLASPPVHADPLCIPPVEYLTSSLQEWDENEHDEEWPLRPFSFEFAPDEKHKANISGATHDIHLPDPSADPPIQGVRNRPGIRLVEYLRVSLQWAGFPGFQFLDVPFPTLLEQVKKDLVPI